MKSLVLALSLLVSVSSFAQNVTGGKEKKDPFIYKIGGEFARYSEDYDQFKSSTGPQLDYLSCISTNQMKIFHNAKNGSGLDFTFDSLEVCILVKTCLKDSKDSDITITVDRKTLKITDVALPDRCDQDPWASAAELRKDRI